MPTVLRVGPYRFYFYANDGGEPPHVHVEAEDRIAKVWLDPVELDRTGGFRPVELREILQLVRQHQDRLLEARHAFFQA